MVALWKRMREMFGQTWAREYGDANGTAIKAWTDALAEHTEEQIARGVKWCQSWENDFPPNLGQFKKLCLTRMPDEIEYHHAPKLEKVNAANLTKPTRQDSAVAAREKKRIAALLRGEQVETREESMRNLKLNFRWPGPVVF